MDKLRPYDFTEVRRLQMEQKKLINKLEKRRDRFNHLKGQNVQQQFQILYAQKTDAINKPVNADRRYRFSKENYHNDIYIDDSENIVHEIKDDVDCQDADQEGYHAHVQTQEGGQLCLKDKNTNLVKKYKLMLDNEFELMYQSTSDNAFLGLANSKYEIEECTRKIINCTELEKMDYSEFERIINLPGVEYQASFSLVQMLDAKRRLKEFIVRHMRNCQAIRKLYPKSSKEMAIEKKRAEDAIIQQKRFEMPFQDRIKVVQDIFRYKDRHLLLKLLKGECTFNQVRARIDGQYRNCQYVVLDDLKSKITDLKGFNSEEEFKKLFYHDGKGEVTLEQILDPSSYILNERCRRSVFGLYNKKAASKEGRKPKTTFGTYPSRLLESHSEDRLKRNKERILSYQPLNEKECNEVHSTVQHLIKKMPPGMLKLVRTRDFQGELKRQVRDHLNHNLKVDHIAKVEYISELIKEESRRQFPNPDKQKHEHDHHGHPHHHHEEHESHHHHEHDRQTTEPSGKNQTTRRKVTFRKAKSVGAAKVNTVLPITNQIRLRIEEAHELHRTLRFLRRLEQGDTQVIWNKRQKNTVERVEDDNQAALRLYLGLDKKSKSDLGKYSNKNKRKPRPIELMLGEKMIGIDGTRKFKMNLRDTQCEDPLDQILEGEEGLSKSKGSRSLSADAGLYPEREEETLDIYSRYNSQVSMTNFMNSLSALAARLSKSLPKKMQKVEEDVHNSTSEESLKMPPILDPVIDPADYSKTSEGKETLIGPARCNNSMVQEQVLNDDKNDEQANKDQKRASKEYHQIKEGVPLFGALPTSGAATLGHLALQNDQIDENKQDVDESRQEGSTRVVQEDAGAVSISVRSPRPSENKVGELHHTEIEREIFQETRDGIEQVAKLKDNDQNNQKVGPGDNYPEYEGKQQEIPIGTGGLLTPENDEEENVMMRHTFTDQHGIPRGGEVKIFGQSERKEVTIDQSIQQFSEQQDKESGKKSSEQIEESDLKSKGPGRSVDKLNVIILEQSQELQDLQESSFASNQKGGRLSSAHYLPLEPTTHDFKQLSSKTSVFNNRNSRFTQQVLRNHGIVKNHLLSAHTMGKSSSMCRTDQDVNRRAKYLRDLTKVEPDISQSSTVKLSHFREHAEALGGKAVSSGRKEPPLEKLSTNPNSAGDRQPIPVPISQLHRVNIGNTEFRFKQVKSVYTTQQIQEPDENSVFQVQNQDPLILGNESKSQNRRAGSHGLDKGEGPPPPEDLLSIFKPKIDINELTPELLNYLYSDNELINEKSRDFVQKTLMGMTQGGLMSISSKNPVEKQYSTGNTIPLKNKYYHKVGLNQSQIVTKKRYSDKRKDQKASPELKNQNLNFNHTSPQTLQRVLGKSVKSSANSTILKFEESNFIERGKRSAVMYQTQNVSEAVKKQTHLIRGKSAQHLRKHIGNSKAKLQSAQQAPSSLYDQKHLSSQNDGSLQNQPLTNNLITTENAFTFQQTAQGTEVNTNRRSYREGLISTSNRQAAAAVAVNQVQPKQQDPQKGSANQLPSARTAMSLRPQSLSNAKMSNNGPKQKEMEKQDESTLKNSRNDAVHTFGTRLPDSNHISSQNSLQHAEKIKAKNHAEAAGCFLGFSQLRSKSSNLLKPSTKQQISHRTLKLNIQQPRFQSNQEPHKAFPTRKCIGLGPKRNNLLTQKIMHLKRIQTSKKDTNDPLKGLKLRKSGNDGSYRRPDSPTKESEVEIDGWKERQGSSPNVTHKLKNSLQGVRNRPSFTDQILVDSDLWNQINSVDCFAANVIHSTEELNSSSGQGAPALSKSKLDHQGVASKKPQPYVNYRKKRYYVSQQNLSKKKLAKSPGNEAEKANAHKTNKNETKIEMQKQQQKQADAKVCDMVSYRSRTSIAQNSHLSPKESSVQKFNFTQQINKASQLSNISRLSTISKNQQDQNDQMMISDQKLNIQHSVPQRLIKFLKNNRIPVKESDETGVKYVHSEQYQGQFMKLKSFEKVTKQSLRFGQEILDRGLTPIEMNMYQSNSGSPISIRDHLGTGLDQLVVEGREISSQSRQNQALEKIQGLQKQSRAIFGNDLHFNSQENITTDPLQNTYKNSSIKNILNENFIHQETFSIEHPRASVKTHEDPQHTINSEETKTKLIIHKDFDSAISSVNFQQKQNIQLNQSDEQIQRIRTNQSGMDNQNKRQNFMESCFSNFKPVLANKHQSILQSQQDNGFIQNMQHEGSQNQTELLNKTKTQFSNSAHAENSQLSQYSNKQNLARKETKKDENDQNIIQVHSYNFIDSLAKKISNDIPNNSKMKNKNFMDSHRKPNDDILNK